MPPILKMKVSGWMNISIYKWPKELKKKTSLVEEHSASACKAMVWTLASNTNKNLMKWSPRKAKLQAEAALVASCDGVLAFIPLGTGPRLR